MGTVGTVRPVLALERSLRPALELRLASEVRSGAGLWSFGSVAKLHQKLDNDNKRHNLRNYAGFGRQVARRSLHVSSCRGNTGQGRMSKKEVTDKLRKFEWSLKIKANGPVKSFDTNNLAANSPIEDSQAQAVCRKGSHLFGIFDGHGGAACGNVVAKRLFHYIAADLLSPQEIARHLEAFKENDTNSPDYEIVQHFNETFELVQDLREMYKLSYINHLKRLLKKKIEIGDNDQLTRIEDILVDAFLYLDDDMGSEAHKKENKDVDNKDNNNKDVDNIKFVTVALSGAVGIVAHIEGHNVTVASAGDCVAVVGSYGENGAWLSKKMNDEHNADNRTEVKRILAEHPDTESHTIIRKDRLLSILAPLRAFGDFKFKWDAETIKKTLGCVLGENAVVDNYKTPPYLTARPDVMKHKLTARDKFMVIASDGLWDMFTPLQVVKIVGEHLQGKTTLTPVNPPPNTKLKDIANMLNKRQGEMKLKPEDKNAATHLIRNALGGSAYGVDHIKLSKSLSLSQDIVRSMRDDITIQVIFFNDEYLRGSKDRAQEASEHTDTQAVKLAQSQ